MTTRTPKHRFDQEEANAAFALLTEEEQREYQSILLSGGLATASNYRLTALETTSYTRLKEKNEQA